MSLTIEAASAASVADYVAGYVDGSERGRTFVNASGTPLNGIANSLPKIASISQVTQVDGAWGGTGSTIGGGWKVTLTVAAVDTTNASSVMNLFLDSDAYFIKASTNDG